MTRTLETTPEQIAHALLALTHVHPMEARMGVEGAILRDAMASHALLHLLRTVAPMIPRDTPPQVEAYKAILPWLEVA